MSDRHDWMQNSRRDFMKKSSAGLIGIPFAAVGRNSLRSAGSLIDIKGTSEDPITKKQLEKELQKQDAAAQENSATQANIVPQPNFDVSGQDVVSYVLKIGSGGIPIAYIGSVVSDSSSNHVRNVHAKGDQHASVLSNIDTAQDYTSSSSVSTQSTSVNFGSRWVKQDLTTAYTEGDNGEVKLQGNHARYDQNYDGDPNKDLWGASFVYRSTPYNNNFNQNLNNMRVRQNWSYGLDSPVSPYITDTSPSGQIDGNKSFDASLTFGSSGPSGTIGWSYTQPDVDMTERTDQNGNDNDAVWKYNPNGSYDTTLEVTCGSMCWFDQQSCGPNDVGAWGEVVNKAKLNGIQGNTLTASAYIIGKEC